MGIQVVKHDRLAWTNVEKPSPGDMEYLKQEYPFFHPLDLEDCLSKIQRPKIDEYDNYLFMVMHFPVFDKATRRLGPSEIDVFIGRDFLVTVSNGRLPPLIQAFTLCQGNEEARCDYMGKGSNYLFYRIIDSLVDYCFPILTKETENIETTEEHIFEADPRKVMQEISIERRNLINFRRIIKPQMAVISLLEKKDWDFLRGDMDVYWGNISDHIARIWDRLEDLKEVAEGLTDTVDHLTSHRLSEVMKYLAIIAIAFGLLQAISGIWGMNIHLPFHDHPYAFVVIVGVMLSIILAMLAYFRKAGWL